MNAFEAGSMVLAVFAGNLAMKTRYNAANSLFWLP
ncbi:Uncharacterised protein [Klebsiella michiganensis]|uniref:Uncharacterized protein n=1 Tax=Klebsiella michiganensis TaxID=1134687 RepID=A0A7H4PKL6_9ENTR|nr:Uncharacterised protein [Klebsiella michiganensis]